MTPSGLEHTSIGYGAPTFRKADAAESDDPTWAQTDPDGTMSVAKRVSFAMPRLRASERKVATWIAANPLESATSSTSQLATDAGVSDASVMRTARALGYGGFGDLKAALVRDVSRFGSEPSRKHSGNVGDTTTYLADIHATATRTVNEMYRRLNYGDLQHAAELVSGGTTTFIYGLGVSSPAANYMTIRLGRIGVDARTIPGTGFEFADSLLRIRPGTTIVLIAPGALHKEMLILLDRCEELDCPVVLMSDTLGPVLEPRAAVWLWTPFPDDGPLSDMSTITQMIDVVVDVSSRLDTDRSSTSRRSLHELRGRLKLDL